MKQILPVFYSCDERYVPFLAVSIRSLIDNAVDDNTDYRVCVLNTGIPEEAVQRVRNMATDRVRIDFLDVASAVAPVVRHFSLRDYYTFSIYYRLFIPSLFPQYDKVLYIDCDTVLDDDVEKLYRTDLGNNLVAAVPDTIVRDDPALQDYVRLAVGVMPDGYFNSGVMLMNLRAFRRFDIEGQFVRLISRYHFPTVAPDQDYLNYLCNGLVTYLPDSWNRMFSERPFADRPHLIHYNMFMKPWLYDHVPNGDRFWHYAERTDFLDALREIRRACPPDQLQKDMAAGAAMVENCNRIVREGNHFAARLGCRYACPPDTEDPFAEEGGAPVLC